MKTPDITPAQYGGIAAALAAVIAVIQTAPERLQLPLLYCIAGIAGALIVSDAILRFGRSTAVAAKENNAAAQTSAWANAGAELGDLPPAPPAG